MIINIDWLQINCRSKYASELKFQKDLVIKKLSYQTRHFKTVEEVYKNDKRICTLARHPHSEILHPETILLKFDNYFLYQSGILSQVIEFLSFNNLDFIGISRIDICADFNTFENNLYPEDLIKDFLKEKYTKSGKSKFKLMGQNGSTNSYDYLSFGSQTSTVVSYLYNKSKELREVKMKPWITDKWELNGIDTKKEVWRLEFRIMGNSQDLISLQTGEMKELKNILFLKETVITQLFHSLQQKHFKILIKTKDTNKSRLKELQLFDKLEFGYQLMKVSNKTESNRSDKIFIKKLNSLNCELRGNDRELSLYLDVFEQMFLDNRNLGFWADVKLKKRNKTKHDLTKYWKINKLTKARQSLLLPSIEKQKTISFKKPVYNKLQHVNVLNDNTYEKQIRKIKYIKNKQNNEDRTRIEKKH
jgi:hypothetical protein